MKYTKDNVSNVRPTDPLTPYDCATSIVFLKMFDCMDESIFECLLLSHNNMK